MSDFKAKMHKIRLQLGHCTRPRWGSLQRSPRAASCRGLLLRTGEGERRGRKRREGEERKGRGGREFVLCLRTNKSRPYVSAIGEHGEDGFWTPAIPPRDV